MKAITGNWTCAFASRVLGATALGAGTLLCATAAQAGQAGENQAEVADPADVSDDIIITGVRASIQRAQDIKRQAVTVVEAISFEDLGKFSDQSIADALQRVPGLQLQRNDDVNSGDRVSIRGLGPGFVSVTLNGRDTLSYGDLGANQRQFNFDSVPPEILSGVLVYKSAQAAQVEPGIAGQVDLQTLRPLDQKISKGRLFGGATAQGSYDDIREKWSPRISGFIGGELIDGTLGFFVSGAYTDLKLRQDAFTVDYVNRTIRATNAAGALTPIPNVLAPSIQNFLVQINDRERIDVNGALQFRPNDNLDIIVDFGYNKYKIDQDNPALRFSTDGAGTVVGTLPPGSYEVRSGALVFIDQSRVQYNLPGEVLNTGSNYAVPQNYINKRDIDQYNGGINLTWSNEEWKIIADYGYSEVIARENNFSGFVFAVPDQFIYDGRNAKQPVMTLLTDTYLQVFDPAVFIPSYDFGNALQLKSRRHAFRLDVERTLEPSEDWTLKLRLGARGAKTRIDYRSGSFFDLFGPVFGYPTIRYPDGTPVPGGAYTPERVAGVAAATNVGRTITAFPGGDFGGRNGSVSFPYLSLAGACEFLTSDYCGFTGPRRGFGQASFTGSFPTAVNPQDPIPISSLATYYVDERNLAFFGQVDFDGALGSLPVDGSTGLRAVRIQESTRGFAATRFLTDRVFNIPTRPDQLLPVRDSNEYTKLLPTLSLNLRPSNVLTLRFNAARTLTLPDYAQLSPTNTTTLYGTGTVGGQVPGQFDPTRANDSTGGNTQLKPVMAWNLDFTAEYYTPNGGAVVFSAFYKDVKNFIYTQTVASTVAGQGDQLFNYTAPVNFADGNAKGFELSLNQPFTFLPGPFDGLGVQAAYTYVDSELDASGIPGSAAATIAFPGASKHNFNAIGYFEKYGFSFRAALNYRSSYLVQSPPAAGSAPPGRNVFTRPETRLDLSSAYAFTPNIEIIGSITNVTGQGRKDYLDNEDIFRAAFSRPRTYSIGVRGRF